MLRLRIWKKELKNYLDQLKSYSKCENDDITNSKSGNIDMCLTMVTSISIIYSPSKEKTILHSIEIADLLICDISAKKEIDWHTWGKWLNTTPKHSKDNQS